MLCLTVILDLPSSHRSDLFEIILSHPQSPSPKRSFYLIVSYLILMSHKVSYIFVLVNVSSVQVLPHELLDLASTLDPRPGFKSDPSLTRLDPDDAWSQPLTYASTLGLDRP